MVFRIEKNKNYTTMSNYHLRDKNLTFKAKGLLSMMLSLPDDWDYSIRGLEKISLESKNTINKILKELEQYGYLERKRIYCNGKISKWEYYVYEKPNLQGKNLDPKNQDLENEDLENWDVNKITKELNTKEKKKIIIKEKFETFWKAYPKKLNRAKALTWFEKHLPDDETFNTIMIKLEMFKNTDQWQKDNGQFIPYATTWLNQKRWEDEIEVEEELNYYHEDGCVQFGRRRN